MTIEEFVRVSKKEMDIFEIHWNKMKESFPERYPNEMEEGDWFDQFLAFISLTSLTSSSDEES